MPATCSSNPWLHACMCYGQRESARVHQSSSCRRTLKLLFHDQVSCLQVDSPRAGKLERCAAHECVRSHACGHVDARCRRCITATTTCMRLESSGARATVSACAAALLRAVVPVGVASVNLMITFRPHAAPHAAPHAGWLQPRGHGVMRTPADVTRWTWHEQRRACGQAWTGPCRGPCGLQVQASSRSWCAG